MEKRKDTEDEAAATKGEALKTEADEEEPKEAEDGASSSSKNTHAGFRFAKIQKSPAKTHLLRSKSTENLGEMEEKEVGVYGWCTGQAVRNGGQVGGDGCVREGEKVFRSGLEKNTEKKRGEKEEKGTHAPDMAFSGGRIC
ncbi:hypothetical protein FNV43_RR16967 [Rhamnella rubrinervis]|uniref:Uncharacterized protein n=1 Tax=Rhamnella rubrinervis TaxID=2594499 RepID=A0A8K0ME49_9ROSA|nr:hypothetical protein FNV43_RR16967 [Rhamnella rubrinervis]